MNPKLTNNIKNVLERLKTQELEFHIIASFGIFEKYVTNKPLFILDENKLTSKTEKNFGFYVLPNAIRGIFKSINFHAAGNSSLNDKLFAPSILNYYTSAFHNLETFLALNGILYFFPSIIKNEEKIESVNQLTVLRYSFKKNKWCIEGGKLSHKDRWFELKRIFSDEINTPTVFLNLFDYFFKASYHNKIIKNPIFAKYYKNKKPILYKENIDEFLKLISNTRHLSAYNSFGSDPTVIGDLINHDIYSDDGIDLQAKYYHYLSKRFMEINLENITHIINELRINSKIKEAVWLTTLNEYFDEVKFNKIEDKNLMNNLIELYNWLRNSKKRKLKTTYA